ncbi:hypothetical protein BOX15_Mlig017246g1 [Macrostomum lignano]|uniref:Uncharacterized protein n=1 Tax=Macrostomum lignano TaxID=282301 RepID=A0A267DNE2_9PLAT|nr:hypothetical protein BOX15_Mlig017246g1 [Macrostomum lignano]
MMHSINSKSESFKLKIKVNYFLQLFSPIASVHQNPGKFLLLNLSNADQANQDVRQRLAQVAPGLDLVHYNIGSIELNRKSFQATGKLILNYAVTWFGSKNRLFPGQGLELVMRDVHLLVRRRESSISKLPHSAVLPVKSDESESSQQQQKPQNWLSWLQKMPELIKCIEVHQLHVCYEDKSDESKPLLAGVAFEKLLFHGDQRSVELHSLTMHLSPPLSQQSQHDDIKAAMSEVFTGHSLKFHHVLQPLSISLNVSLIETNAQPRAVLKIFIRGFKFDMTSKQYDLLTGQVDRLNRLFRQDVRAATNNARGADSSAAGFSRNRDSDSAGAAANQFNAKVMLDADQICFALREGRTSILDVKLDKIEASLKRIAKKYSLKASLGSLSALGYDGRQLVATEACRCCHTKLPNGQSKFVKLCRPDKSPYILDIGACRIVHCVSTANRLANFFQVSSSSSAADEAEEAEPELDEELLKTLRFLTRRGVGRNGAGRSGGTAEKDRHRFRGHLDGLSFHLPTGPLSSDRGLTCLMDEVELLWLKTGPAESNLVDEHLRQLCLAPETAPNSVHQLTLRLRIVANQCIDKPIVDAAIACGFGVNAPMDLPKMSLVFKTQIVQLRLSPEALATVAGAAKWSGPSLTSLLGVPSVLPNFSKQHEQENPNKIESPLKWQAYAVVNKLVVTMETTKLKALIERLRLNAVKQPNWLEARLFVDLLSVEDLAHPQPVGAGSKLDRSRPLRLLSSQLDAVEVADSGFETQGAKIVKRLKRVPYKIPDEDFGFLSLSAVVSPERMSAETQLDALGACLQPDCLAGCLHLAEDVCNRLADLPLPPPVLAPQHSQDGPARPHRRIRQSPPPPVSLELRLTNARLDLASAEHQILCVCRLSELRIEASATYERPASTGGAMTEYRLKRELQLECTGLEADTGRSCLVPNRQRRRLYAKPLLADLPDEPVARIRITSWPAGPGPSRLDIDCKLNKVQLVLLPELMAGLKEFSTSIQEPLEQLQSRLNWQAGDVLESAQTEIRQAGGLTARAEISAPRLILPLRGGAGNRALYADLGSLLLSSTSSSAQSNSDDTTDAVQFYEFSYSRPALKELFTPEDAVMTSSSDMALLADELRVRISGLSASVCQLAAGSRVGDLVVAGQGSNQLGNSSRLLRFYGESDGNKIGNEQPVLTAQIARLRCSDATISDEHCCQAWLAVAMETPGLRLVADRSDLLSIASLAASEIAESGEDSVDGVDQLGRPAGTRWAYDLSVGACSVGLVLRRQRPSTIWQLRLADAGVEAVAHDESEGEGGVQREPLDRWSIFSRSVSKSDSNSKPTDLLSIRSLPRSLTVRLAACQLRLWPDELPLLSDCMATMAAQGQPAPSNQAKPRETEPSSVAAAAASPEQRFSPALSVETSALRVQIFQNARPQPNSNHGNQTASGGGGGNAFCFQLGGFNGSFSETELTDLCLTFYKDGFRKPMTLQDSAIADGVELLSTETICLSLPAPTLIFKSRLNIRIAPSAVSSAVSIVNTWQPLLRPQQTAATTSASPASSKMFGSLTVATNTVSMVIGDSPTGAGSVAFSLDHLTVGFEHASCSATFERPSASASLTSTSAELIEEPLLILETPSSDSYQSACTYPRFQLAANWSADVTSVVLSCPLHRICLVVSPAVAAAIAQLVENLRQAFAGSRPSTKNDDIGRVHVAGNETEHEPPNSFNGNDSGQEKPTGNGSDDASKCKNQTGTISSNGNGRKNRTGSGSNGNTVRETRTRGVSVDGTRRENRTGSGSGDGTRRENRTGSGSGDGTGRENGTGTGNGSQAWKFRVDLHSIGILLRLDSNLLTTMTTTPDGAACQRCRGSGRGCRNVANLSIDNVGPVWLKTKLTGVKRRFVRLKPDAAAAVERLYRRWLSTPVSSVLSNQSSVELVDSDQWRVCFEQLVNDNAITSSSSISSSMKVGMTMLQPKSRRLYRRCLPGFVGQVEFSQQPDKGEVNRPVRFQIKLGRLQVDQSCPQAPDQFRVPLSLKARPKADVLGEGRLLGADLKVCMAAAGSAEVEDDGASAQPPPLHISEMSLALGRLDLCYDPAFFVRLLATLTPQSDAPSSGVRIDRFQLLRNLRLYAENLPLRTSESAAQGNGWRLRATVPAGNALGVAWPDNDGGDAQQWARREFKRLIKRRPGMAVTLPLGCLLGTCLRRKEFTPVQLSSWMQSALSSTKSTPIAIVDVDVPDSSATSAAALLHQLGRCCPSEQIVAVDSNSGLLLTTARLIELHVEAAGAAAASVPPVRRQFRLLTQQSGDGGCSDGADAVENVEATVDGVRLLPGGETLATGPEFARKFLELMLPENDTAF